MLKSLIFLTPLTFKLTGLYSFLSLLLIYFSYHQNKFQIGEKERLFELVE